MARRLFWWSIYLFTSTLVFLIWVSHAQTEAPTDRYTGVTTIKYSNLVALAEGTQILPFVGRRLLAELARGTVVVVPQSAWEGVDGWLAGSSGLANWLRRALFVEQWPRDKWPLLLAGNAWILLSIVGFSRAMRKLLSVVYDLPLWWGEVLPLFFVVSLLGGMGKGWDDYPYDFPNLFVFTMALVCIYRRSLWFFALFPLAVFSKETALLLLVIYAMIGRQWSLNFLLRLAALALCYVAIRGGIQYAYADRYVGSFLCAVRNTKLLFHALLTANWYLPFVALGILGFFRQWHRYPPLLKESLVAVPVLVIPGFLYGGIEERRAYYEFVPFLGPLLIQMVVGELQMGWLMPARSRTPNTAAEVGNECALPRTPEQAAETLCRFYAEVDGLAGALVRLRPYICPFEEVLARIPQGADLLDVGCGPGIVSNLAVGCGRARSALGFDVSEKAIATAAAATLPANAGPVTFTVLPADQWPSGTFAAVACIDVLHHVPPEAQRQFVRQVCGSVAGDGTLIVKDISPRPAWKAWANRLHDLLLARQFVHYVEEGNLRQWLGEEGFIILESGRWDRLWYGHVFFVARRDTPAT